MTYVKKTPLNLATVEELTGLSREVLRKWELRYGFPLPARNARGHRLFKSADVEKLRLMAQLLRVGLRAGTLVTQNTAQLHAWLDAHQSAPEAAPDDSVVEPQVQALLASLETAAKEHALGDLLDALIRHQGLARFVTQFLPAFSQAVGLAWENGLIGIHAEHRFSQAIQQKILRALPAPAHHGALPRVLMTTPPGELHTLGLLGLQVQLDLAGANCINLSAQTPVPDVVAAVNQWGVSVVCVSVSICLSPSQAGDYLQALRRALPEACQLWVGGQGCAALSSDRLLGCDVFTHARSAVLRWRELAEMLKDTQKEN
jgi:DNA-binding transcriptional MerR regulator/methylmalonyl-CoA mutase cobalamin-binding subunit